MVTSGGASRGGALRLGRGLRAAFVVCLAGLVAGCGADDPAREFAPRPNSTGEVVIGSPGLPIVVGSPTAAVAVPPTLTARQLLRPRGAPAQFYFLLGDSLATLAAGAPSPTVLVPSVGDRSVVDYSASPSGDRVAVLERRGAGGGAKVDLVVFDGEGNERRRIDDVGARVPSAGEGSAPRSIDWAPQGDQLVLAFGSGALATVAAEGQDDPKLLAVIDGVTPTTARWSPTGEAVVVLGAEEGGEGELLLVEVAAGSTPSPIRPVEPLASARPVSAVAWAPDGRALLIVERPAATGPLVAGDLWQIGIDGGGRRVVASAGTAGPAARVALVRPSPSGAAVAYTIAVAEETASRFHSLRVKELESGRGEEVPVPEGETVTDLWWTAGGLVFRTVPRATEGGAYDGGPFALYQFDGEGEPRRLLAVSAEELATPPALATPVAGPDGA